MTDARALREGVEKRLLWYFSGLASKEGTADEVIALVLEEAARVVRRMPSPSSEWMADELLRALCGPANQVPEDIRALKSGNDS